MSSNQIGGFFNRLEGSRKYLFGSVGVLGKANDSIITGAVICRGKDFKPVMEAAPDCEWLFDLQTFARMLTRYRGVLCVRPH
jgi:elongation factor 1-gamma